MSAGHNSGAATLLVVTDLDGTLLDHATYSFEPARPALAALRAAGGRLVLASSKTHAEMARLAAKLGGSPPLIVENGGALVLPQALGAAVSIPLGVERPALVAALAEIGRELGVDLVGWSRRSTEEVAAATGLDLESAALALAREHDEPFELGDEALLPAVVVVAERRGLEVSRGGRFFHLTGGCDKGRALARLLTELGAPAKRFRTVGLGDAGNDRPLLAAVERPIVVPRPDGRPDGALAAAFPDAELAPAPGPEGWNGAVLAVLLGSTLPRIRDVPNSRTEEEV